jgi:hypothetical protein
MSRLQVGSVTVGYIYVTPLGGVRHCKLHLCHASKWHLIMLYATSGPIQPNNERILKKCGRGHTKSHKITQNHTKLRQNHINSHRNETYSQTNHTNSHYITTKPQKIHDKITHNHDHIKIATKTHKIHDIIKPNHTKPQGISHK